MRLVHAMIAWTPDTDRVTAGPWPDETGWSAKYDFTEGACERSWRECSDAERVARLFILFNTMIVRDGMNPQAVHRALYRIDEYHDNLAPELQGKWYA